MSNSSLDRLFRTVVDGGYCVGCGACAHVQPDRIKIMFDEFQQFVAARKGNIETKNECQIANIERICPFSNFSKNEDELARSVFPTETLKHDSSIGYFRETYAGFVAESDFRQAGSSGGMGSWLISQMFEHELIDAVAHVRRDINQTDGEKLFSFGLSFSASEAKQHAKSHYYPVEMSTTLARIRDNPGRYALVGLPCFIKAVRQLILEGAIPKDRIVLTIGLVCGHQKSGRFAGNFAWQNGIFPRDLEEIDFRQKLPGNEANKYGVRVKGLCKGFERDIIKPNHEHFGYLWGHGFFKYKSCDFCDDVFAETADITIGDAWLPQYLNDSLGTNIIIVRDAIAAEIIQAGIDNGKLDLENLSPNDIRSSQDAGLRHRREGLAYRLGRREAAGVWYPPKRIKPETENQLYGKRTTYYLREVLRAASHHAFRWALICQNYKVFYCTMWPLVKVYNRVNKRTRSKR